MEREEWEELGIRLFGEDRRQWEFVCPVCGHVARAQDWPDAGAPDNAVAFSCVGRWLGTVVERSDVSGTHRPCNYAGGGLFRLNPIQVMDLDGSTHEVFAFHVKPSCFHCAHLDDRDGPWKCGLVDSPRYEKPAGKEDGCARFRSKFPT